MEHRDPLVSDVAPDRVGDLLDHAAPGAPLAAFGQTPFWDEPLKCLLASLVRRPLILGIHDLDYFSRLRAPLPGPAWRLIAHNDGRCREAWVAAGELSALFGAEAGPTRAALAAAGVRWRALLPKDPRAQDDFLDAATECWGWRGIVRNVPEPELVCDLAARDVAPSLKDLLAWGAQETARRLADPAARRAARAFLRDTLARMDAFLSENPSAALSNLYLRLYAASIADLLGGVPEGITLTTTRALFRFNRRTAALGRFRFAEVFLRPRSSEAAARAYDDAVAGAGIRTLAEQGPGATPFDLYAPGWGRGMVRVLPDRVQFEFASPVAVPLKRPLQEIEALADVAEGRFGADASLIAKAVALPAMLCGEFVMVLHDTGSAYVPQTRAMLAALAASGAPSALHPILRIRLGAWDALGASRSRLSLPPHLEQAFGRKTLDAREFAQRWRRVAADQENLLQRLGEVASPCEFVGRLGHEAHEKWFRLLERCNKAQAVLLQTQRAADRLRHEALDLRAKEDEVQGEISALERQRGDFNRAHLRPLKRRAAAMGDAPTPEALRLRKERDRLEKQGRALLLALESKRVERRSLKERRREVGARIRAVERGAKAAAARRTLHTVLRKGEEARLALARRALLALAGLRHGDARPSAWWLRVADPSGAWWERLCATARFRLEPLPEGER